LSLLVIADDVVVDLIKLDLQWNYQRFGRSSAFSTGAFVLATIWIAECGQ